MTLEPRPTVLILGTGAMASMVGACLARAGEARVTLAGTWARALEAIRERGITVEDAGEAWTSTPGVVPLTEAPAADIVLVLVKATRTADTEIALAVRRSLEAGGTVVTLQNGLGNRETLEQGAGLAGVAVGVATLGATLLGPGHVRAFPGRVLLGLQGRPTTDRALTLLADLLSRAGLPAEASPDVDPLVWSKLAVNCAINALAALTGLSNGALLRSERLRTLMGSAAAEVAAVAMAKGIRLAEDPRGQAEAVALATTENRASMLQDMERGVPTEVDFLNGAVVREARRLGVRVPVNEWLWRSVHAREATQSGVSLSGLRVATTVAEARTWRRGTNGSVGFVPTMGALHAGHLALVERARRENDKIAASVFVNPAQFAPHEDLSRYPRDLARDRALLEGAGVDLLFAPRPERIYPPGFSTAIEMGGPALGLEGERRPGHFRGVATVVLKLLNLFAPERAYFGQKDAQQLAVVRRLVRDLDLPVAIVGCPTVREPDGLALSSRNVYLGPEDRQAAAVLHRALVHAQALWAAGERHAHTLRRALHQELGREPRARVDYAAVVDPETFVETPGPCDTALAVLAVFIGTTRLIDNALLLPEEAHGTDRDAE